MTRSAPVSARAPSTIMPGCRAGDQVGGVAGLAARRRAEHRGQHRPGPALMPAALPVDGQVDRGGLWSAANTAPQDAAASPPGARASVPTPPPVPAPPLGRRTL